MKRCENIFILDDEPNICASLRLILEGEGFTVSSTGSVAEFSQSTASDTADLLLLDVRLPDGNGIDVLRKLRARDMLTPVVMISGHGTIRDAMDAVHAGAHDFLEKPLARDRVLLAVRNALSEGRLRRENRQLKQQIGHDDLIAESVALRNALDLARRAAATDVPVLLEGETGTGKEVLATFVHRASPWCDGPFVKLNCAAIPADLVESELFGHEKGAFTGALQAHAGRFLQANNGTLLLDEIGELALPAQAKLLRVLQDSQVQRLGSERPIPVRVRLVASTNRDLKQCVAEGKFREDLYYRLAVLPIRISPLRERPQDIAPLATLFLQRFCERNNWKPRRLDDTVLQALQHYDWPGNVRELRNTIERMAILANHEVISLDDLPAELRDNVPDSSENPLQAARHRAERELIKQVLDQSDWNIAAAAQRLQLERTHLHKRIKALGLKR